MGNESLPLQPIRTVVAGRARMTPSEAFVETLVAQGVTDLFGIVGGARPAAAALVARLAKRTLAGAANRDARLGRARAEKEPREKELADWAQEKDAWSVDVAKGSSLMHPRQM